MNIQKYYDSTMVRVSDYKKLEAENQRLREALEEIATLYSNDGRDDSAYWLVQMAKTVLEEKVDEWLDDALLEKADDCA
jgi:hypothetical protein